MLLRAEENLDKLYQELSECSFHKWYNKFEKISIPAKFLKIPQNIVEYLRDDIVILPKECYPTTSSISDGYDNEDTEIIETPEFPEFSNAITEIIKDFSNSIFLKTNWHSPKDARWITAGQTLKVKDITDAYQLLKASSIIKNDLININPVENEIISQEYYLVLKEWREIHPGTEYRCFVKNRSIIAISPRDWPQFHKHILVQRKDIVSDIVSVFKEKIKFQFPLDNFVFDVVRAYKDKVFLVDFSPFNERFTEGLAFEWNRLNEIDESEQDDPEFRYLTEDCGIQPNCQNNYGIPHDIIDMFNNPESSTNISINLSNLLASTVQQIWKLKRNNNEYSAPAIIFRINIKSSS